MKILFITTQSFIDHSFTMVHELKKHIELDTIIIAKKRTEEIDSFCRNLNAGFHKRARFSNPLNIIFDYRLLKMIKKYNADLVWFNTISLFQVLMVKFFIRNFLISTHDIEPHPEDKDYNYLLAKRITLWLFKNHIAVMSISQSIIFEKNYRIKPYLIQLPIIDYYEFVQENINKYKSNKRKTCFLFFGNIMPYKGIELLLKAAEILNAKNLEFEINVFGRLSYNNKELEDHMEKIKNLNFKNERISYKHIQDIFLGNDVLLAPYEQVTQSGPLLVGYNRNMPCITSDLPGFREYVDDGKSGLIFNNTAEGLAEKMELVIKDKGVLNEMSKYISVEIKNRFSMQSLTVDYISIFKKNIL